jgi:septation ring formation regulator EzrA
MNSCTQNAIFNLLKEMEALQASFNVLNSTFGKEKKGRKKKKIHRTSWPRIRRDFFTDCRTKLGTTLTVLDKKLNRVSFHLMRDNPKIIESQSCRSHHKNQYKS